MSVSLMSLRRDLPDPDASWSDKLDDTSLIMLAVIEQIRTAACELVEHHDKTAQSFGSALFGALYLAEIGHQLLSDGHSGALKEGVKA